VVGHPSALLALQLARTRIDMVLDFAEASDAVSGRAELERVDAQAGCGIAHARVEAGRRQVVHPAYGEVARVMHAQAGGVGEFDEVVRAQMDELDRPPGRSLESARRLLGTDALWPLRDRGIKDAHG